MSALLVASACAALVAATASVATSAAAARRAAPVVRRVERFGVAAPAVGARSAPRWWPARPRAAAAAHARVLPQLLEEVARGLRGGASLRSALVEAAESAPPSSAARLAPLLEGAARGRPLTATVAAWVAQEGDPGTRLAAAAIALAAEAGGAPARSLDAVAATLRERLAVAGEVRALAAQARLSALVIGVAPVVFAAFAAGVDSRTAAFLLATPLGVACLLGGAALDAAGLLWMRRIVEAVAR